MPSLPRLLTRRQICEETGLPLGTVRDLLAEWRADDPNFRPIKGHYRDVDVERKLQAELSKD